MSIQRSTLETHIEANGTPSPSFGFPLQTFDSLKPLIGIVIGIDVLHTDFFAKLLILSLSNFIFSFWVDVGIVKENRWSNSRSQKRLENFALTGSAA